MSKSTNDKSAMANGLTNKKFNEAYQSDTTEESFRVRNPGEAAEIRWEGEGGHTDDE